VESGHSLMQPSSMVALWNHVDTARIGGSFSASVIPSLESYRFPTTERHLWLPLDNRAWVMPC
jgi:hypothetical protein